MKERQGPSQVELTASPGSTLHFLGEEGSRGCCLLQPFPERFSLFCSAGDSHTITPSFGEYVIGGQPLTARCCLVTGIKACKWKGAVSLLCFPVQC